MTGEVSHPPPAKRQKKPSTTGSGASSLGDDLLHEIFLRLPSLATLVRAAHTCRSWRRAVASCRAFRRRFRATHPAPHLGLYSFQASAAPPAAFPSFAPTRFAGKDQAAAVRGGDFFLTSLEERSDGAHGWEIHDCHGGYVLLCNGDQKTMCVINPLAPRSRRFFQFSYKDMIDGHRGIPVLHKACLLLASEEDEDPFSFRVVRIANDESRLRAKVFSSDTQEWSLYPWVHLREEGPPAGSGPGSTSWLLRTNMQANGFMYWIYTTQRRMVTLDTATMSFSVDELPICRGDSTFSIGETSNGESCILYAFNDFRVRVLPREINTDGVQKWLLGKSEQLETELHRVLGKQAMKYCYGLQVVAVRDGFAYLATLNKLHCAGAKSWILSLSLETMKLQDTLFERTSQSCFYPYVMSWPSTLLGNYGFFALEYGNT
ncbi:hypothetical protein PR202_gb05829 [Eleusine coracana subsp. coracana]|uniref:F-box domain-containing protein n=1 Tax=Eleusine coracana subsp. coracana TaxID=191504 RepID=A0AAV5E7C4_ELECO|nr:hypothetical protein QOZ80_1BG0070690 [Eleusine coracana subsp. coracana]GJN18648.1 hypothetical protein PR202_gb05829 [Eleusine coracana subsp. coracana]